MAPAYNLAQWAFLYATLLSSMLAGATVVHVVLKPDLVLRRHGTASGESAAAAAPASASPPAADDKLR